MEDRGDSGQKQMESPHRVIHTYYQGDINSVVDEHFFRALNKTSMPKDLSTRSRDQRRAKPAPDFPASSSWSPPWSKGAPGSSNLSHCSSTEEPAHPQGVIMGPLSSDPWVYPSRQGSGYDLPQLYRQPAALPGGGSSFLHLLHMERPSGGALTTPSSKTDMQLDLTGNSHRDLHGGQTHLDTGMALAEKRKDVYWY